MTTKQERIHRLEQQIERLRRRIDANTPRSNRYSWLRVFVFFGGIIVSVALAILVDWWVALPVFVLAMVLFGVLAHYHSLIERSITRHTLWMHIKSAHIARMKLDWDQIPEIVKSEPLADHPFEFDLDITGHHSIHRLLNTAISTEGSQRLRDWLLARQPDMETLRKRQEIVQELVPMTRFRDRLILNSLIASGRLAEQLEGQRLIKWLEKQETPSSLKSLMLLSALLNIVTIVLFVLAVFLPIPHLWYYSLGAVILLFFMTAGQRGDIFDDATYLRYGFATLSTIFTFLETYSYGNKTHLNALCEPFVRNREYGPTALLKGTARISSAATLKNNGLIWFLVNAFIPWDFYCAYRLGQYKKQLAARLPEWLDVWFEIEALCSLASFSYLNPEYTLPELVSEGETTSLFSAQDLGHPLLVSEKKVTNSFALNELGEVVIITGSNMAGKSTFLRTLGVNLCLAYAGTVVNASTFRAGLLRLFTCIRVTDSVTDGYSYFYAEVRRLHALLEALKEPDRYPLFFLVDEIFKGTNNRERLIGSRSFVHALVGQNCVGLISTHDLELVKLADILPQVHNHHFREEVVDGHMVFDYVLREGPCPTTNALKIMAMEGLPIDDL
ncbi:MAG TPA: hypothetical protein VL461_13025 [Dictyobacter sp.]|nr:hypothetical protein [Dictyobacter sp.]